MATENDQLANGDTSAQSATGQPNPVQDQVAPDQTNGDTPAQPATDANAPQEPQVDANEQLLQTQQQFAELQANYQQLQQQVQMMAATPQQPTAAQPAPQAATEEDPYSEWDDYDYVPLEAARARDAELRKTYNERFQSVEQRLFDATHQDYAQVVGQVDPTTGQLTMSEYMKSAITKNPALVQWIKQQPNEISAKDVAYQIAKQEMQLTKANTTPPPNAAGQTAAQAYAENSATARLQPGSAAAVGGDGAVNTNANVAAMADNDFDAHERDVLAGRFDKT